ncbi:hypothetical protein [Paucibacter sp. DJ2R-2]|uniref:hypothetical protein n=1 Tax=Paucibacter sp. DJ2R-2 TaxID=2893558 RepID=UPI0021E39BD3|nr:hypothetical protein [Paucibacter sp. DJ2R-2]MCV2420506.1 hypothetical protein [Paucibacter sp. DJ4R-1]MCV2439684.1 hypothetical protein [Paucibacter sp. DJ2R-2]
MSPDPDRLAAFVCRQLENFYPDDLDSRDVVQAAMPATLDRVRHCVGQVIAWPQGFDPVMSGQYASFLYFLSNEVGVTLRDGVTATRLFLLNKALHGLELFYDVALPEVFLIGHTPGLVFAKASFGSHLVFHQGCTIGHKLDGHRPHFEGHTVMFPGSMVIGHCRVRANTVIAPGVVLVDCDTPGDCYVLAGPGGPRKPIFKALKAGAAPFWQRYFHA